MNIFQNKMLYGEAVSEILGKQGRKKNIKNIDIHYSSKGYMLGPSNSLSLGRLSIHDRVSLGERSRKCKRMLSFDSCPQELSRKPCHHYTRFWVFGLCSWCPNLFYYRAHKNQSCGPVCGTVCTWQ